MAKMHTFCTQVQVQICEKKTWKYDSTSVISHPPMSFISFLVIIKFVWLWILHCFQLHLFFMLFPSCYSFYIISVWCLLRRFCRHVFYVVFHCYLFYCCFLLCYICHVWYALMDISRNCLMCYCPIHLGWNQSWCWEGSMQWCKINVRTFVLKCSK